jgi:murein DD-endopeptidase MepM/ murein hydrolase activator NlpD
MKRGMAGQVTAILLLASLGFAAGAASGAPQQLTLDVSRRILPQGTAVLVTVRAAGPITNAVVRFAGRVWPLFPAGDGHWRTLVGTDPTTSTGRRTIVAEAISTNGARVSARRDVTVTRVAFRRRRITFDRARQNLLTPEMAARERRLVAAALRVLHPDPLWSGPFALPLDARVSSPYGVVSIYQGVVRGFHAGVDFAADEGTPVRAAADGIVRFAGPLPISGNAVLVDHGLGIVTSYLHLSAATATVGGRVAKGTVVGRVGATGLATGPHLHWGLRVHNVRVDPLQWTRPGFAP